MDSPFAPRYDQTREPHPKQVAFEDERVRIVLDRFGLSHHIPEMVRRFEGKWGQRRLTFESFFEVFPSFPILLEAHSFFRVAERCRPADLFRAFGRTFLLRHYLDVYARGQSEARGRPVGMVFPFAGFQGGLVVHDGDFDTGGTKMVHVLPGGTPPGRVVAEPFIALVNHLARGGWTPDAALPARRRRPRGPRRTIGVSPRLVRLLGCGPDILLLAFLLGVLRSKSGHDRLLIRVRDGRRYVAAGHAELAGRTGLSGRQVKRAVGSLRARGLISAEPQQDGGQIKTHFLVDREALRCAGAHDMVCDHATWR